MGKTRIGTTQRKDKKTFGGAKRQGTEEGVPILKKV